MNYQQWFLETCVWYLRIQTVLGIAGWICIIVGGTGWLVVCKLWPLIRGLFSQKNVGVPDAANTGSMKGPNA